MWKVTNKKTGTTVKVTRKFLLVKEKEINMYKYATGAEESPKDIRTFSYIPSKTNVKGGKRYSPRDIEEQSKVGICTANSTIMHAQKATGKKYSADFQYLLQKKLTGNWDEGSSLFIALKVTKNSGFLPLKHWKHTTQADRKLPYHEYIEKLKTIPEAEIERLLTLTEKPVKAYASVPTDRDSMANAIDESPAGILTRYPLGKEWWSKPIEPLRPPKEFISGHAVIDSNYDGNSFRIANGWGIDWNDKGTAYRLHTQYKPTEAWIVYYEQVPEHIEVQLAQRLELMGRIKNLLQKLIALKK